MMKSSWILLKGIKAGEGKMGCNRPVFRVGGIFRFWHSSQVLMNCSTCFLMCFQKYLPCILSNVFSKCRCPPSNGLLWKFSIIFSVLNFEELLLQSSLLYGPLSMKNVVLHDKFFCKWILFSCCWWPVQGVYYFLKVFLFILKLC